ncbi:DUF4339 domain-containing protein [Cerasicoccus fimbriatus]|uniref:DUF4339 domain-containing protein n=1 Tax=Cerasicoccus fimbriatus TaxID=3014554 RepID=UPI0022B2EB75|nr:DUF4339 domain-containing protein [Cerasicoccus sp. TK19100]
MIWHYAIDGEKLGPVSDNELAQLASSGKVDGKTLIWRDPMENWKPLEEVPAAVSIAMVPASPMTPPPMPNAAPPVSAPRVKRITLPALNRPRVEYPLPSEPVVDDYGKDYCDVGHHIHLYPAILKRPEAAKAQELMADDESSCFFHPQLSATQVCSHSGRFICDLCATEWNGEIISLQALSEIKANGKSEKLNDTRKLWDSIALALVTWPLLLLVMLIPAILITAPIAVYICLWQWKKGPTSIVRQTRIRYIIALTIGIIEILTMIILAIGLFTGAF